ncbi:LOW QUALITY PROTEIN: contactin-associated protein-like 5 [Bufo gargarizans]|uniref:LOW QUALITY PROTEIN: contactin-associated protein-like 5 n=1 Tax=Bufo gargarizans TaxID=30331 RepID=UPI001CF59E52|nr:LOW QUALITY PROTEIN: contactin-associated protein-like 5 [Bufo gargarizans]
MSSKGIKATFHQNYIGTDAERNPFFLSVVLSDQNNQRVPQYRAILWRKTGSQKICLSYCPTKTLSVKSILSAMNLDKFEKSPREILNPEIQKDLLVLEEQEGSVNFKFGVLYAKDGQLTDDEMFSNEAGSESFQKLLDLLGDTVTLKSWIGYRGGLDTKNDTTGIHSVYTVYQGHEIMFHVSTMLPYSKENKQQVERKRHIGNDIVTIVFQEGEESSPSFKPSMIRSHFTHIFALVRYNKQNDGYRLKIFSEESVPLFGPPLPSPPVFSDHQEFRDFLLVKLINGEKATLETPTFAQKRQRTLDMLIRSLYQDLMPDLHKNMLNRRSLSDVLPESPKSARKKEEARQAEFVRIGQALKLKMIVRGDAPTSLASTGLCRREPWEAQCFCNNFSPEAVGGDSWGPSLLVSTDSGVLLIDDGQPAIPIFDRSLQIRQMHVLEPLDLLITRADKGKDARLYVFWLSAIRKDLEDNQAPRNKYECRENKLEKTKGCHLYAINTHHSHELRVVVAIRNKLLLITRKPNALNSAAGSSPVEAFQYIRYICPEELLLEPCWTLLRKFVCLFWLDTSPNPHQTYLLFSLNPKKNLINQQINEKQISVTCNNHCSAEVEMKGCPDQQEDSSCTNPISSFQGCMRLIFIDNQPKDLILVQRGVLGNFTDLQIDMCGIKDRCLPNYCEHGGECSQTWSTFHCDCGDKGYADATCHSSLYEQSCEAYRHKGYPSDYYYIDSDGSGPLGPVRVYCNITEEKIWTIVGHNITEITPVLGSFSGRAYSMSFNYSARADQLEAMIHTAEYCEQEVAYYCRHSRLLNSPNGAPFTWWIGKGNERHTYWGGSLPGQCTCGLEESCIDMRHYCNCDADRSDWTSDIGFLTFKEHLPVSQIVITDTNRSGSEVAWKVGALRCYGDRSFWNSASFTSGTSYLYFPTFHSDFSIDISFFFKTTSSSGVFLENLGVKDLIRIELVSPYQVTFSFDVGSGALEVSLQSVPALNDGQWHYVRAERNIKETSLVIDNQPRKLVQSPSDGRARVQLSTQLYVGGTSSRQKGFVGCMRSLQLNGQTLDLEEKARLTSGIRPGCPGHCSSYGNLCNNNGRCVEKRNGYTCDCTNSAYEGPYCRKEVSAMFEAGTSVTYMFQEPYPVSRNTSASASAIYADTVISRENIAFSFLTAQAPSLLLYVTSVYQDYLAVMLCRNGSLQVRYKLSKEGSYVFTLDSERLDNRRLHHVRISREGREITVQIDKSVKQKQNFSSDVHFKAIKSLTLGKVVDNLGLDPEIFSVSSIGFIGCLSSVQYNQVAPLKAALRHPSLAPVTVIGSLTECSCGSITESDLSTITTTYSSSDPFGKTDDREPLTNEMRSGPAVIGGVIAVTIFIIFCIVAIMTKIIYQHKKTHGKSQSKEKEYPGSMDYAFRKELDLQNTVSECKKEYFI